MTDRQPPSRPRGAPLRRTDADLDRLSAVTPDDLAAAAQFFRDHAPHADRTLPDAAEEDALGG